MFSLRKFFLSSWLLSALLIASTAAHATLPIEHWTQTNGAKVYFVQSPAIAMVDVQIDFDGGSRRDPAAQTGLAFASSLMMSRGIRAVGANPALDENALSEAWADLGAHFGARASDDRLTFVFRSLTDADLLQKATLLAARQMAQSSLPANIWDRERERSIAALKEAQTRPATHAAQNFEKLVYGDHPYGQQITPETLNHIRVGDMQTYLSRTLQSCDARVSIVGALNRAKAQALVETLLSFLPKSDANSCVSHPTIAEVKALSDAQEKNIAFDSAQAHVLMGQPGFKRDDPDFFALTVGNYILGGGGFVSRLTEEVREKRGLSYSVYSYFAPGLHAGAFTIGLQTRPDQAKQAVQLAREVVQTFVQKGPTSDELQAAKDNLVGGFALRIDSNKKLLENVANIAWNRLPLTYLDTWTTQIERITKDEIQAAFARKLQPEKMVTVIVGAQP